MVAQRPTYCPHCGTRLTTTEHDGRDRRYCEACDRVIYRNPVPGAGVAVVDGDRVLLVERDAPPGVGEWSVPGGHLEVDESPREGAARELREETGLRADPKDLLLLEARRLTPIDGKHMVSVGYAIRWNETEGEVVAGSDARDAAFVSRADFSDVPFALPYVSERVRAALDALGGDTLDDDALSDDALDND